MGDDGHGKHSLTSALTSVGEQIKIRVVIIRDEDGQILERYLNSTDPSISKSVGLKTLFKEPQVAT